MMDKGKTQAEIKHKEKEMNKPSNAVMEVTNDRMIDR